MSTDRPLNPACGEYDALPEGLKDTVTPKEWLWKTDAQKADYVRQETEPEV
jgi:hypothetical protein